MSKWCCQVSSLVSVVCREKQSFDSIQRKLSACGYGGVPNLGLSFNFRWGSVQKTELVHNLGGFYAPNGRIGGPCGSCTDRSVFYGCISVHTEAALVPYKFLGATEGAVSTYEIPHGIPGYLWNCSTFIGLSCPMTSDGVGEFPSLKQPGGTQVQEPFLSWYFPYRPLFPWGWNGLILLALCKATKT